MIGIRIQWQCVHSYLSRLNFFATMWTHCESFIYLPSASKTCSRPLSLYGFRPTKVVDDRCWPTKEQ